MRNHPLAHEGNPRENDLTITAGSVLSTAQLEILIPALRLPSPDLHNDARVYHGGGSSCPDVFSGGVLQSFYTDAVSYPRYPNLERLNSAGTAIRGHGIYFGDNDGYVYDTNNVPFISMRTSPACWGIHYSEHPGVLALPSSYPASNQHASGNIQMTIAEFFDPIIEGDPYIGVIMAVKEKSTVDNCTMWGLMYDFATQTIEIRVWVDEPFATPGAIGGTQIQAAAYARASALDHTLVTFFATYTSSLRDVYPTPLIEGGPFSFNNNSIPGGSYFNGGGGIACAPTASPARFTFFDHQKAIHSS